MAPRKRWLRCSGNLGFPELAVWMVPVEGLWTERLPVHFDWQTAARDWRVQYRDSQSSRAKRLQERPSGRVVTEFFAKSGLTQGSKERFAPPAAGPIGRVNWNSAPLLPSDDAVS